MVGMTLRVVNAKTKQEQVIKTDLDGVAAFILENNVECLVEIVDTPFKNIVPLFNYKPIQGKYFTLKYDTENNVYEINNIFSYKENDSGFNFEYTSKYHINPVILNNGNFLADLFWMFGNVAFPLESVIPNEGNNPKSWFELKSNPEKKFDTVKYFEGTYFYFDKNKQLVSDYTDIEFFFYRWYPVWR